MHDRSFRFEIGKSQITNIENFLGTICDDHHIYDEYYANILMASTLLIENVCKIENSKGKNVYILFNNDNKGMHFIFKINSLFLDIAKHFTYLNHADDDLLGDESEALNNMYIIKLLADELHINPHEEEIELVFNVKGINKLLANQRVEILNKYYSLISETIIY